MAKGQQYLEDNQWEGLTIECSAAEMHLSNENYEQFKIGQKIHCFSEPHILDKEFPLMKMSLRLDQASKTITLGTPPRQKLTEIYKDDSMFSTRFQFVTEETYEEYGSENGFEFEDGIVYGFPVAPDISAELEEEISELLDQGIEHEEISSRLSVGMAVIGWVLKKKLLG